MKLALRSLVLLVLLATAACGSKSLQVGEVWAAGEAGGTGAVYFVINNPASRTIPSPGGQRAPTVEMHMSMMQEDETMTMMHQEVSECLPESGGLRWRPARVINLKDDLNPGDVFG
jgi:hypothetical protein